MQRGMQRGMPIGERPKHTFFHFSPAHTAGLVFSISSLLPYSFALQFSESIEYLWFITYLFSGLSLTLGFLPWKRKLVAIVLLLVTAFSEYRLLLLPLFFLWLTKNILIELVQEEFFAVCLFALPALFLLFNLLGVYFAFPTAGMIWFFGLPLFLLGFIISAFAKKKAVIALIICNIIVVTYAFSFKNESPTFYKVETGTYPSSLDQNTFLGLSEKVHSVKSDDISKVSDKNAVFTVILPEVPTLLQNKNFPSAPRTFFLFGEHDNLRGFIKGDIGKEFNPDRYRRKSPWGVYQPIMNYAFLPNFNRYLMYCSNLGCTLNEGLDGLPLIWEYNSWGIPKILARITHHKGSKIYLFGDSDPVVGFLSPYNRLFLYDIYNMSPFKWIPSLFSLLIIGTCFYFRNPYIILIAIILTVAGSIYLEPSVEANSEITIIADGKWLSPHYDHSFSSLPKKLAKAGHTVSISDDYNKNSYNIWIINNYLDLKKTNVTLKKNLIVAMPNSKIKLPDGRTITVEDLSLGGSEVSINGSLVFIKDFRQFLVDGKTVLKCPISIGETILIATGSPSDLCDISLPQK
jgi:hypothetical protein